MFVPGGVTPAEPSYANLLRTLGDEVHPLVKDLEVYATDAPPADYSLQLEADGIAKAADAAGAQRFHLVAYSGGAACALAFVAQHPERVISLGLTEPAWIGSIPPQDRSAWDDLNRIMALPPAEQMQGFRRWHLRPGIASPKAAAPADPPPPWMSKRPAGLKAMLQTFNTYKLDQSGFRRFKGPVYYAVGSLSSRFFEHEAEVLAGFFADFRSEEYSGLSHFDPPHRAEPERFARALRTLWQKASQA